MLLWHFFPGLHYCNAAMAFPCSVLLKVLHTISYRLNCVFLRLSVHTLASVALSVGASFCNQMAVGLIPGKGAYPVVGSISGPGIYDPWSACV